MGYGIMETDSYDLRGKYNVTVKQYPNATRFIIGERRCPTCGHLIEDHDKPRIIGIDWAVEEPTVRSRQLDLWERVVNFLRCLGKR